MYCPKHGALAPDWSSCPYCLRENNTTGGAGAAGPPRAPTFASPGYAGQGGNAALTRGGNAADTTRGSGPGPGIAGGRADVTRGADALGNANAPFNAGSTRIVDAPLSRRRIRAWLIENEGPRPDQIWQLSDDVTWIGRDRRNQICLDDDTVSSQHAKLWVDDDRTLHVLNVSTSNGTRVNDVRVEAPIALEENDEIRLGAVVLVLKRLDSASSARDASAAEVAARRRPAVDTSATPSYTPPRGFPPLQTVPPAAADLPPTEFWRTPPGGERLPQTDFAPLPATERVVEGESSLSFEE